MAFFRRQKPSVENKEVEGYASDNREIGFSRREILIGGEYAGYIEVVFSDEEDRARIKDIVLEKKFRGKGYGKTLYQQLGEELAAQGIVLYSDEFKRNDASTGVWDSLVRDGKAKKLPSGQKYFTYEYTPDVQGDRDEH